MDVLVGRNSVCRHAVAIEPKPSQKARERMARAGLDIETMLLPDGVREFSEGLLEHAQICLGDVED